MRPATLAFVILGCVAAATAALTTCADGSCSQQTQSHIEYLTAVTPVEHHRVRRSPKPILGKAALLGAGALGIGALGVGALGVGALGAGALGAGVLGAGVLGAGFASRSYGGYGGGYGGGYSYSGPHYHYHSSPVVYSGGYGGGYGGDYSWGYGGGYGYGGWY